MEVPTDDEVRAEVARRRRAAVARERAAKQKAEFDSVRRAMIWERTPCWLQVLQFVCVVCGALAGLVAFSIFVEYMRLF